MSLLSVANSRLGPWLAIFLASRLPRPQAQRLALWLADRVAADPSLPLVRAVRGNLAVVRGLPPDDPALDGYVAQLLRNAGIGYVDVFRGIARGQSALLELCRLDPGFEAGLRGALDSGRGVVAVGAHMSSFDLFLLTILARGFRGLGLAFREIQGSYPVLNRLRREHGLEIMTVSVPALRAAIERLRQGGLVITGVDRPVPEGELLPFFGRPARMPTGHARLALRTGALIAAGVCQSEGDGRYRIVGRIIDPQEMGLGRGGEIALTQKVLSVLEGHIRERPEEWLMFFPVWEAPPAAA